MSIHRIVIGPTEVSGIGKALISGFAALEVTPVSAFREPHRFGYGEVSKAESRLVGYWQQCFARWRVCRSAIRRRLWSIAVETLAWCIVATYARPGTAFIYMFAGSFTRFPRLEYALVKWRRARIVFLNLGSDLRPPYMDGPALRAAPDIDGLISLTRHRRRIAEVQEQRGDVIIAAPSCGQFLSKPFLTWFAIGIPQADSVANMRTRLPIERGPLRVLHAPSDPAIKGTDLVRAAVRAVQESGIELDYVELHDVTHDRVLAELRDADLLIDQAFSDLPMSGFGAEGATFGVPAIVAGYYVDFVREMVPEALMPPSIFVHPEQLEVSIRALAMSPSERSRLGRAAREFVLTTWRPASSAQRIITALDGRSDPSWLVDPMSLRYFWGCGAERSEVRNTIRQMVDRGGYGSLQLMHNPAIEHAIAREIGT